jgi:hypothetical protein
MTHLALEHEHQLTPVDLQLNHPFHIVGRRPIFYIKGHLLHSFFHVVNVGLLAKLLLNVSSDFYEVGLGRQDLFDVSDALILHFQCLVNSFESQLNDILDVCPLGIRLQ